MLNNTIKPLLLVFLAPMALCSCHSVDQYELTQANGYLIEVNSVEADKQISEFLAPYRDSLQQVMDKKISYSPEFLDRKDPRLGAWLAKLSYDQTKRYLLQQGKNEHIDIVLYNAGGMRTTMPQGDITNSFVYEFMPFDNACVIVKLKAEQLAQMFTYLAKSVNAGVYHPAYGFKLDIKDGQWTPQTTIGGKKFDPNKTYTVLTSDFLQGGGDHMDFFKEPIEMLSTNIKIREQIADYFSDTDTISIPQNQAYEL